MSNGSMVACFAAAYLAALIVDAVRPYVRPLQRPGLTIALAGVGIIFHTWYLATRAAMTATSPLSSPYDWYLLAAWVLAAIYFYLAFYFPQAAMGLFVMPLVLALIGAAQFADPNPFTPVRASRFWGNVHGVFLLLGTVTVMLGFIAGMMYLVQSYRLKHKLASSQGFRLPSLEWLQKVNSRAILTSVLLIGIGFVSGMVLNSIKQGRQLADLPWDDPVVLSLAAMLAWLIAAAAFNLMYRPARQGRKVAYLTVASFIFLAISLFVLLFVESEHSPGTSKAASRPTLTRRASEGIRHLPEPSLARRASVCSPSRIVGEPA